MNIRPYRLEDESQVVELWTRTFPITLPHHDPKRSISRKLKVDPELFLVAVDGGAVIGTAMGGYDGHRGWIYSVAVDARSRRKGVGSQLLSVLESELAKKNCPKVNLQIDASNAEVVHFYENNGYSVEPRISMGKVLARSSG
jgi:ribosomal protein S18 acetylase RimI-like enzyme